MAKTILVVEDDKPIANALTLKLLSSGFRVETVFDGAAALMQLKKQPYDLVVLDLIMPIADGFTVLKEMKARKINVPVLVCSNLGQEEDIERTKEFNVTGYFIKSETPLVEVVKRIFSLLEGGTNEQSVQGSPAA